MFVREYPSFCSRLVQYYMPFEDTSKWGEFAMLAVR